VKNKAIIIVCGEPKSVFLEIFLKALKYNSFRSPIILITSLKLLKNQMKKYKFKRNINLIDHNKFDEKELDKKSINLINVKLNINLKSNKISSHSNLFIENCFNIGLNLIKRNKSYKFINGPISKKNFLKKKFPGMTEYIAESFNIKNSAMLIYNKNLSVCPLTTHMPIKSVTKIITKKKIYEKISLIDQFYKKKRSKTPKIAILGLNPHCESIHKFNEDEKIVKPAIEQLIKRGLKVSGPFPADTMFLKKNRKKYDVIVGMYHDQVLTPMKTLYEYDAINMTLGLPFYRISPDHGPNVNMIGKNKSNPLSLISAIKFLDKN
tara:strand:+ start:1032 stop:1997 length:966 start_codon:yes stop_codon:yes gene_type:complete